MRGSTKAAALAAGFALLPAAARGQGPLGQASYDNLRPAAIQVDVGSLATRDFYGALVTGVRLDAGLLAPRVRVLVGVSYTSSSLSGTARDRLNQQLAKLIQDPDSNATLDVGHVVLDDVILDGDLQYGWPQGARVTMYLGVGVGVHVRNGRGSAISGTFIEDALDGLAPSLNGTVAAEIAVSPLWRLTVEARGALLSDFSTASLRAGVQYRFGGAR